MTSPVTYCVWVVHLFLEWGFIKGGEPFFTSVFLLWKTIYCITTYRNMMKQTERIEGFAFRRHTSFICERGRLYDF